MTTKTLHQYLESHIAKHTVASEVWPDDAVYMACYRLQAWPTGAENYTQFFPSAEALSKWHKSQVYWAQLEDNYFWLDNLYMWDLGPVMIDDVRPHISAAV